MNAVQLLAVFALKPLRTFGRISQELLKIFSWDQLFLEVETLAIIFAFYRLY